MLLPYWRFLSSGDDEFERVFLVEEPTYYGIPAEEARVVFGERVDEMTSAARADLLAVLRRTRGLCPVDRLDIYSATDATPCAELPQFAPALCWMDVRGPMLSRRWIEAVLSGAPRERIDDLVRLRLIRKMHKRAARVPWNLTRLPLGASEAVLLALRGLARVWPVSPVDDAGGPATDAGPLTWLQNIQSRIYAHGEQRDEWLRDSSRPFVERVLLSDTVADRGLMRPEGVRRLIDEHLSGIDRSAILGQLLNIELWHRLFVDDPAHSRTLVRDWAKRPEGLRTLGLSQP